ncbi:MAG: DUF3576 domain-containing protein [Gemmobacter sp.]
MTIHLGARRAARLAILGALVGSLAGCGGGLGGWFGGGQRAPMTAEERARQEAAFAMYSREELGERQRTGTSWTQPRTSIWQLFGRGTDANTNVNVNRHLWNASLDVLNFLPVETVDPFSGVISTGYGTPPGGGRAYRATIYISDPALDARSLKVALQTRGGGPVSPEVVRQVEDAILTRARELRVRDSRL